MITRIPASLYRGGTSKGPLILAHELPRDRRTLDAVLLAAMGSPHPRQVDGIGGAETLTSKIAVISKSARPHHDVDYLFVQVNPESDIVDYSSNCGNMLSAVGPYAIESGLVAAGDPQSRVRIYNINTNSTIEVILQTPRGERKPPSLEKLMKPARGVASRFQRIMPNSCGPIFSGSSRAMRSPLNGGAGSAGGSERTPASADGRI